MSRFSIQFDFISPEGARGPELRATWGRLAIYVDDRAITRVYDDQAKTVRDHVYGPLYPLAEWLAANWFFLLHECETPGKSETRLYQKRHNLRFAGDGYALPSLLLRPEGSTVILEWQGYEFSKRLSFLPTGCAVLEREEMRVEITRFQESVLARLNDGPEEVPKTFLEEEWGAIKGLEDEERDFCRVAAALGKEPFALSSEETETILAAVDQVQPELVDDFFLVTPFNALGLYLSKLNEAVEIIQTTNISKNDDLGVLRETLSRCASPKRPWEQGYDSAKALRNALNLNGIPVTNEIINKLGYEIAGYHELDFPKGIDAVLGLGQNTSPVSIMRKKSSDESRRFAFCRALFDFLTPNNRQFSLLSNTRTEKQKCNRAFAAEFLAPEASLRKIIRQDVVDSEQLEELAKQFQVEQLVIEHQIRNHGLARIEME